MRTIRILRNISSNYLRLAVTVIVGVVLTPIMVHGLGDGGYGLWVAVFSLTGYFGLFDQGIRPSLVRYVSRYQTQGDTDALSRTLSGAVALYGAVGLLTLAATFLVAGQFSTWFNIGPDQADTARSVVTLSGLTLALGFPMGVFGATLSGLQRYDLANAVGISVAMLRAAAFVIVLETGGGLVELATWSLALNLAAHVVTYLLVRRLVPGVRLSPRFVRRDSLREIGSYSLLAFVGALANTISFQTDALVVTAFMGAAWVTPFALAATLVNQARQVVNGATFVLSPTASELDTLGEKQKLHSMLIVGSKYAVLVSWPLLLAFLVFGENILVTWVGPKYAASAGLLAILAVPTLIALPQAAASSVLFGVGRHHGVVALSLLNAVLNLGLSLLFVRPFGLYGVAWGTAIPLFTVAGVAMMVVSCRALDLPMRTYLWAGMLRPGLIAMVFLVPAIAAQALWHPVGWLPLLAAAGVSWLIFAAFAWRYGVTGPERGRWARSLPDALGMRRVVAEPRG